MPIRIPKSGNTYTLEYTITPQLIKYEIDLDTSWFLVGIRYDATYEMRLSSRELSHELSELFLVPLTDCTECTALDLFVNTRRDCVLGVFGEKGSDGGDFGLRQESSKRFIDGILVLFQPASGAVLDISGIVLDNEPLGKSG